MFGSNKRMIKFLSFSLVFMFVFATTNVPVQASSRLSNSLKKAYVETLNCRADMEDIADFCVDSIDCEKIFDEYYIALEAYEEDEDNALYRSVYTQPTRSKQKTSSRLGTPVNFLEYNIVGFLDDDGERDVEVYRCKGTLWLKKISGEYVITKAKRAIKLLDDYTEDIADYKTVNMLTEIIDEFIEEDYNDYDEDYDDYDYKGVEVQVTECPTTSYKDKVTISGKVSYDGEEYASLTINGDKVKVDSYYGTWSQKVTLKEGTNTFTIVATDRQGKTDTITKPITYKCDAPSIIISKCPETSKLSTVTISGSVSDRNDKYPKVYINGDVVEVDYYGTWSINTKLKEGNNTFEIKAINSAGKITIVNKTIVFSTEGPTIVFTSFPETSSKNSITVSGRVNDSNDKEPKVYINDDLVGIDYYNSWSKTVTLKEGVNTFTIKAINSLGKVTTITKTITFNVGTPDIFLTNCPETSTTKKVTISGRVSDTNDTAPKVYINDELLSFSWSNNWSKEVTLKEGSNTFTIKAVNKLGKVTTIVKTITFSVGAPEIMISECPDSSTNTKVTISGRVNDTNDSAPKVYINDDLIGLNWNNSWSKEVILKEGSNTYTIKATNSLGKTTTLTKTINFTAEAPNIYLTSFPDTSTTNTVTIYGSVNDKNDGAPKVYINGDQLSLNWNNSWSKTLKLVDGLNKVEIKAVNSYGKTNIVTKTIIYGTIPPTLEVLACPETANAEKVTISGKVSDLKDSNPSVYINNELVSVVNGEWSKEVTLASGANTIVIKATNTEGKETMITKTVNYTPIQ